MKRIYFTLIAVAAIGASGWIHGRMTDRWGVDEKRTAAAERIDNLPLNVGPWEGKELEVKEAELRVSEATRMIRREYVASDPSVRSFGMMLVCGRFGPVAVHPPTVCFTGAGMLQRQPHPKTVTVTYGEGEQKRIATFLAVDFRHPDDPEGVYTRTYWGWANHEGQWQAPDNPRAAFAGSPYLYKIYFMRTLGPSDDQDFDADSEAFFQKFLPEVDRALQLTGS